MKKLLGIFMLISFFLVGCKKSEELTLITNTLDAKKVSKNDDTLENSDNLQKYIKELENESNITKKRDWIPPKDGISVSSSGYLIFESQAVLDAFVVSLNDLSNIEQVHENGQIKNCTNFINI